MTPKKQYLVDFIPPKLPTNKPEIPHEKDRRKGNSTQSPPTRPIAKGQSGEYLHALFFFTVVIVQFGCRRSKQHRTPVDTQTVLFATGWQHRAPREVIPLFRPTLSIPEEEQPRRCAAVIFPSVSAILRVFLIFPRGGGVL